MKTTSIAILSCAFLAAAITSCGKSTKRKMDNEWKATAYESTEQWENSAGDKYDYTISMSGNVVTEVATSSSASTNEITQVNTGTVNTHELEIKKDGTWTWTMDYTFGDSGNSSTKTRIQSGIWNFVGNTKGDDFKKNERVLFQVLNTDSKNVDIQNQVVVNSAEEHITYTAGENTMIYTITKSTKDKLEMELESRHVITQDSQQNMNALTRKISLEEK